MDTMIAALHNCNLSASQFIISILRSQQYNGHHVVEDLLVHCDEIFDAFIDHPSRGAETLQHTNQAMREQYIKEIKSISSEEAGWHFGPSHTTTQQVEDFNIEEMGREMQSCAPALWDLLGFLLGADSSCKAKDADADIIMDEVHDEYDSYWDDLDDIDLEGLINGLSSGTTPDGNKQTERCTAIVTILW
ncbi:hypothetical protein DFH29DRAFT_878509 [Suillus ampliporus]|nr:hypothetical protein DFH29DRAFT_878509 [Suillus ampliporus]